MHRWISVQEMESRLHGVNNRIKEQFNYFTVKARLFMVITSNVSLEELCQVSENNPGGVAVMSSGLSQLGLGEYLFLTKNLHYGV